MWSQPSNMGTTPEALPPRSTPWPSTLAREGECKLVRGCQVVTACWTKGCANPGPDLLLTQCPIDPHTHNERKEPRSGAGIWHCWICSAHPTTPSWNNPPFLGCWDCTVTRSVPHCTGIMCLQLTEPSRALFIPAFLIYRIELLALLC